MVSSLSCDGRIDGDLEAGRSLVEEGEAEIVLAREALTSNDQEQVGKRIAAAQSLFLDAQNAYLRARADRSRDLDVLSEFAVLTTRNGDYDLTAKAYRRAAEISPESAEYWLAAGINCVRVGKGMVVEAQEALQHCIELATASGDEVMIAQALAERGHLNRMRGLYELAREDYASTLELTDALPGVQMAMAGLDFRDGNVLDAAARVDALGTVEADSASALEEMLQFGFAGFRETRGWFSDTAENHMAYARLLTRVRRYPDALHAASRAAELNGRDVTTLNLLGSLARQSGDSARAVGAFERSLAVDPNQPRTLEALEELRASLVVD